MDETVNLNAGEESASSFERRILNLKAQLAQVTQERDEWKQAAQQFNGTYEELQQELAQAKVDNEEMKYRLQVHADLIGETEHSLRQQLYEAQQRISELESMESYDIAIRRDYAIELGHPDGIVTLPKLIEMAQQREARLRDALQHLHNEASGSLYMNHIEMRRLIGNTNFTCLAQRIQEAEAALSKPMSTHPTRSDIRETGCQMEEGKS